MWPWFLTEFQNDTSTISQYRFDFSPGTNDLATFFFSIGREKIVYVKKRLKKKPMWNEQKAVVKHFTYAIGDHMTMLLQKLSNWFRLLIYFIHSRTINQEVRVSFDSNTEFNIVDTYVKILQLILKPFRNFLSNSLIALVLHLYLNRNLNMYLHSEHTFPRI